MIRIRPATLPDLPRLIVLFQDEIAYQRQLNPFVDLVPGIDWRGFAQAKLDNPQEQVLVAEHDGQVVGYIDVRVSRPPQPSAPSNRLKRLLRRCGLKRTPPVVVQPRTVGWIEDCYVSRRCGGRGLLASWCKPASAG